MKVVCLWLTNSQQTEKTAELCLRFSPQIAVRKDEAVFIEIGKCKNLYTPEGFAQNIKNLLNEMQIDARIAYGLDITDALVRAKYGTQDYLSLPLTALNEFCDPFNRDHVARKYLAKMIDTFAELGIKTLGEFQKISTAELTPRFGPVALLAKQRLNLEVPITWPYWKIQEIVSEKTDFPYFEFYGELEPILFELKKLLDQIFHRLWARELKAQKLQVKIFCESTSVSPEKFRRFDFDFLFAQSSTKGALNIIKERLARDFETRPILTPLQGVECRVLETVKGLSAQKNLLNNNEEAREQKQTLIGQLSEKHGRDKIFQAELVEDRRPERSWKKVSKVALKNIEFLKKIPERPTHLLSPRKVQITAGFLHYGDKKLRIVKWSLWVERISGGWHEQPGNLESSFDRNYYKVELENGLSLAVFQTPNKNFYLHGYYG